MEQGKQKLLNPTFGLLLGSGLAYFVGMSMLFPTLPSYVISGLGGSNFQVGLAVGIMGISAVVLRLAGSGVVDIKGRRWTIVFGATTAALGHFLLIAASNIEIVTLARLLTGLGEAAYFVGLASAFGDLAPENRRAESASYFSAVLYLGFVIGPILGEQLQMQFSYRAVWIAAGSCCLAGALLGLAAPSAAHPHKPLRSKRLLHPAALLPAGVAVIGLWGFASFMAFAAPWATELGIGRASSVFLTFACVIMLLRIGLARLGDRLGARTMSSIALALSAGGLATIASWQNPAGLFVGTVILGCGQSFFFPALLALVIATAPVDERGRAIGTFSASFDLSIAVGSIMAGVVSDYLGGIPSAFWMGSASCVTGMILSLTRLPAHHPKDEPPSPKDAAALRES